MQGASPEFGLIAPGLGFDHFLDLRMDAADAAAGKAGGTPRTIEGPLYVAGAPLSKAFARLDDGTDAGDVLIMHGRVLDERGTPVAGAVVDVWHANTHGAYSTFDPTQPAFNNRRRIETSPDGAYKFQSVVPAGYAVPSGGSTERLLGAIGRHGRRPAHIHFFVSAPGRRSLTTQINIAGDPDLHDDFAQATRDGLIPDVAEERRRRSHPRRRPEHPVQRNHVRFHPAAGNGGHARKAQGLGGDGLAFVRPTNWSSPNPVITRRKSR